MSAPVADPQPPAEPPLSVGMPPQPPAPKVYPEIFAPFDTSFGERPYQRRIARAVNQGKTTQ